MQKIKFLLVVIMLLFSTLSLATQFKEGQQYVRLNKQINNKLQVIEFFSFYCSHCYNFEEVYQISNKINKTLPVGAKIIKYHVNFLGPMGKQLTRAWAVAMVLGIEDKISSLIFNDLQQKEQAIQTLNDIRMIFAKAGINKEKYNSTWNSYTVASLVYQQEKLAADLRLCGVPAIFVNGKYMIKQNKLDMSSLETYIEQFTDIIKFLLRQK